MGAIASPHATGDVETETRRPTSGGRISIQIDKPTFLARAWYVGEHIDLRSYVQTSRISAQQPAIAEVKGGGLVMMYRYGAVVFFDVSGAHQQNFLRDLKPLVRQPYELPETEEERIYIHKEDAEGEFDSAISLKDVSVERLQIVGAVLSKSVVLAQYEADITANFERIEPFAVQLEQSGRGGRNMRQLLKHIGRALLDEHKMVARVEVTDRPELIWDHPELEQLYLRLADDFQLTGRAAILDRKLELISRTVGTVLDLLQKRRSVRVEWYIVFLILLEISLNVYDLFSRSR